jgi:hypothetical protein
VTSELPAKALTFALDWHGNQKRKGTDIPYVSHLLGVASLVLEGGGSVELHAPAAFLHDVVEDTGATLADVDATFGPDIAAIVGACGDKDDPTNARPWTERKSRYVEHLLDVHADALLVSLADKVHNCSAIVEDYEAAGPALWGKFNQGTVGQLWYYRSLLQVFEERREDVERFAGDRHGRPGGGAWLLDRLGMAVRTLENLAEDSEPDAVTDSWSYGPGLACPACHQPSLRQIVYGMPGVDLAQAAERGGVILGGCIVDDGNPRWECVSCGRSYVSLRPLTEALDVDG